MMSNLMLCYSMLLSEVDYTKHLSTMFCQTDAAVLEYRPQTTTQLQGHPSDTPHHAE